MSTVESQLLMLLYRLPGFDSCPLVGDKNIEMEHGNPGLYNGCIGP